VTPDIWDLIQHRRAHLVIVSIANTCNQACRICYMSDKEGAYPYEAMTLDDVRDLLGRIGKRKSVMFFGGEPTTHEDLPQFIALARKLGHYPQICTNGLRLADPTYVDLLARAGMSLAVVSLDDTREEGLSALRGTGHLEPKLAAIENLTARGVPISLLGLHVPGHNDGNVERLLRFVAERNPAITSLHLQTFRPAGRVWIDTAAAEPRRAAVEALARATGWLDAEYFTQFDRLRINLHRMLNRLGTTFPVYGHTACARVRGTAVEPVLPLSDLYAINESLERGAFFDLARHAVRYARWAWLLPRLVRPATIQRELASYGWLNINVSSPTDHFDDGSPYKLLAMRGIYSAINIIKRGGRYYYGLSPV
jgi:molybdenum cofactor biosynthesis enzyme MoaA